MKIDYSTNKVQVKLFC